MSTERLVTPVGLPPVDEEQKKKSMLYMIIGMFFIPRIVLGAVSVALYFFFVKDSADESMAKLKDFNEHIGYIYFGVLVFSWLIWVSNHYALAYENLVFAKDTGALRTNMFVYKTLDPQGTAYVVLEQEGVVGEYNRANRGLYHTLEYVPIIVVNMVLTGPVFPTCIFATILIYAFGRILYQRGAAKTGWPKGTMVAFAISNFIAMCMFEGFAWVVFVKTTF